MGPCHEFTRRFVEWIGKLVGNISGDHRKKIERLTTRMPEAAKLTGVELNQLTKNWSISGKPLVSGSSTYAALDFGWLSMVEPPRLGGELPVARNLGTFDG
ncbi:hypothetical protein BHM03_00040497 [Ensete ventricosum]|nr:hypothetical protein BHM03_00040497 [Ensete ventricosum]